jgi:hypothetical protein
MIGRKKPLICRYLSEDVPRRPRCPPTAIPADRLRSRIVSVGGRFRRHGHLGALECVECMPASALDTHWT